MIGHVNELAPAPLLRSAGSRIAAQAKKTNFKGMTQCTVQILKFCTRSSHGSGGCEGAEGYHTDEEEFARFASESSDTDSSVPKVAEMAIWRLIQTLLPD